MSGGVLVGAADAGVGVADAGVGAGAGVDGRAGVAGAGRRDEGAVRSRRTARSPVVHWVVGHAVMLAVMASAMVGGHSVARTGAAVLVFLAWAAVVAVRVRLGRLPADVHSVVDLLAMAAITAVPLLTAASGGGHHGAAGGAGTVGAAAVAAGTAGGAAVAAGASAGAPSVGAVLVASGIFAAWIVFRSGLRGIANGAAGAGRAATAERAVVAEVAWGARSARMTDPVQPAEQVQASGLGAAQVEAGTVHALLPSLSATRLTAAGTAVTAASLGVMVLAIASGWH